MHLARILLAALVMALASAPAALAVDNCVSACDPEPEPDPGTPPTAAINGPATAVRTADTVTFNAAGSTGGEDGDGNAEPITNVEWDLDGVTGYESSTGTSLTKDVAYLKGFKLGTLTVRVRITSATGSDTKSRTISIVNRNPVVSLSVDDETPVTGQQVTFTGTAGDADSSWSLEAWKFNGTWCGPVSGCSFTNYNRVFTEPGTYTQTFGAEDSDGGWSEVSRTVTIRSAPTAALSVSDRAVAGDNVTLDASASTGSGPRTYRWDVDGNEQNGFEVDGGTTPTLTRSFPAGDHGVRVQVKDHEGNPAVSAKRFVTVHALPTADFSYAPAQPVVGDTVTFESLSTDDGWIVLHQWDLDGDEANGFEHGSKEGAQRVFAAAGQYVVRLRVNDNDGGEKTVSKTITVKEKPVVEDPKGDEKPADGGAKDDRPATGGTGTTATPGAPGTSPAPSTAPSQQQRVAQPAPAVKPVAKKKAKKRCAAPKGKKARGKKAKKACGKAKKARRAKKRR